MTIYLSFLLALQNDLSRGLLVVVILMAIAFGGNYFISRRSKTLLLKRGCESPKPKRLEFKKLRN